ncbi:hypothetical protein K458DRAFT_385090 [Lentithecium fluviatile CBS 122367]|uniref:DUF7580 domain-containing protein n=1 Tax=Lentithecium fluviatile CBS 122367 TaxID=1168545 RepID=A0A6G1JER4_9PLEO|nr:hypothetical protein K458DRAFT_385090 [Lentithecium fluviatile CBS 122367]
MAGIEVIGVILGTIPSTDYQLRRVKGRLELHKCQQLLDSIDRDIDKLDRLTTSSFKLEPLRVERRRHIQSIFWQNVRDQARGLFESLNSRFLPCSCNRLHQANLRLDRRQATDVGMPAHFALLLTFQGSSCNPQGLPWRWKDIELEYLPCISPWTFESVSPVPDPARKRAHFGPSTTVSPAPDLRVGAGSPPPELAIRIDNLCRTIIDGYRSGYCLGILDAQRWQYNMHSVLGPGSQNQVSEAKYVPSCATPSFFNSQVEVFAPQPNLRATEGQNIYIQYEQVFALGVALLELAHGSPLSSLKRNDDLNDSEEAKASTEYRIAMRLADRIHEREPENYAKAVIRCIRCNFDAFKIGL